MFQGSLSINYGPGPPTIGGASHPLSLGAPGFGDHVMNRSEVEAANRSSAHALTPIAVGEGDGGDGARSEPDVHSKIREFRAFLASTPLSHDEALAMLALARPIVDDLQARVQRPLPEIAAPSPFRHLEGKTELVVMIVGHLDAADAFCAALVCRKLRDAVFHHIPMPDQRSLPPWSFERAVAGGPSRMLVRRRFDAEALDPIGHTMSVSRLHFARSLGGLRIEPSGRSLPLEPRRCPSRPRREADEVCCAAAYHGNIAVLEEARRLGYQWDERTPAAAARMGHIHVLKWLRSVPAKERCAISPCGSPGLGWSSA